LQLKNNVESQHQQLQRLAGVKRRKCWRTARTSAVAAGSCTEHWDDYRSAFEFFEHVPRLYESCPKSVACNIKVPPQSSSPKWFAKWPRRQEVTPRRASSQGKNFEDADLRVLWMVCTWSPGFFHVGSNSNAHRCDAMYIAEKLIRKIFK